MPTSFLPLAIALAGAPPAELPADLVADGAQVEKVAGGFQFVEGPAWSPGGFLLFSDIPANRIARLGEGDATSDFLKPSGGANGLAFDGAGVVYACQGGDRKVVRIDRDGKAAPLADSFGGKKLNSPNDLALDGAGGLYFTDPRYGQAEGVEQDVMGVYHVAPDGKVERVISSIGRPNGILVSAGAKRLYVADPENGEIRAYPITAPGKLGEGSVLYHEEGGRQAGGPDGMALDARGNIYATYRAIAVVSPEGKLLGRIPVPEHPANCKFGGKDGKTLYITARTSLYRLAMKVSGPPLAAAGPGSASKESPRAPSFRAVTLDDKVKIGYAVAIADVDGDRKKDVLLVDKDIIAWYRNPGWEKSVIAEKLTPIDHVCIAARDIDGDGKAEVAVGAAWNPGDTVGSGSVHYLVPPADRAARWAPVDLHREPTVHRMRWVTLGGKPRLIVVPLHGKGNKDGQGEGIRILAYSMPADPKGSWETELVDGALHVAHNLDPVQWDADPDEEVLVAAKEGVFVLDRGPDGWTRAHIAGESKEGAPFRGASEVRTGRLPGGRRFVATVEPFHGNAVVAYVEPAGGAKGLWAGKELDATLNGGHAVACADVMGRGSDQLIAGWRLKDGAGKVGIRLYVPLDGEGKDWSVATVDDGKMACEDVAVADLDGDGRIDITASGRDTHNLVVYWNGG
jgi:sugar lactone lactonase YvrE